MDRYYHRAGLVLVSGLTLILSVLAIVAIMPGSIEGAEPRPKAPVAVITHPVDLEFFLTGTSVEFNGSSCYDPDGEIVQWDWWFADGTTIINASQTMFHTYTKEGRFHPHLMVTDDTGLTSNASLRVVVSNNTDPQAEIAEPAGGWRYSINQTLHFSPDGSLDPIGGNLTYCWSFGDGTTSDERYPAHRYVKTGHMRIELTVTNETGATGMTAIGLMIGDDVPMAVISSPVDGGIYNIRENITFSADGTYDPDGDLLYFMWDFGDTRGYNWTGPPQNTTHKYSEPGEYRVRLGVRDDYDLVFTTIQITVTDQNRPPVIVLSGPAPHATFHANLSIHFSAEGSYDPDGDDLNYTWWWGRYAYGGGGFKVGPNSTGIETNKTYPEEGIYTVILTVRDELGLETEREFLVPVVNDTWIGVIILAPSNGTVFDVGESIAFKGTLQKYDITRPFLNYTWEFGDGSNATGLEALHAYSAAGRYCVTLWIFDGLKRDKDTVWFDVSNAGGPSKITLIAESGRAGSDWFVANETVRFSLKGLNASFSGKDRISWEFGDGSSGSGLAPEHRYLAAGKYNVTVTVPDGWKNITISKFVTVHSTPLKQGAGFDPAWLALGVGIAVLAGAFVFIGVTEIGVYSLFSFMVLLYTKIKREEVLDNFVRGQIQGYIVANPGDHYNSIRNALKLNNGTLAWHLRKLEDEGIVKGRTDGIHKRFYPFDTVVPEPDGGALTEVQRMILARVRETPGISQKDIAGLLKVSGSTVNYHIGTLVGQGKVRQQRDGMKIRYFATELAPHNGEKVLRNEPG